MIHQEITALSPSPLQHLHLTSCVFTYQKLYVMIIKRCYGNMKYILDKIQEIKIYFSYVR